MPTSAREAVEDASSGAAGQEAAGGKKAKKKAGKVEAPSSSCSKADEEVRVAAERARLEKEVQLKVRTHLQRFPAPANACAPGPVHLV